MEAIEATEESSTPRFATVVRGYDRMQVDDYVTHLSQWIEQADNRAQECEAASARAAMEVEQLRRRLSTLDAETLTATPESMKALGNRVGTIMQSSFHAAKELHDRAQDDARATTAAAEERGARIIAEATAQAGELSRAAEDLFGEAKETLAGARAAVAQQVEEARARGEAARAEMLEKARSEMHELAGQSAAAEKSSREQLAVLEEHRRLVLEEVGLLHERLGSIGEGLAAPVGRPVPRESQVAPHRPASSPQPKQSPQKDPPSQTSQRDDDTVVVALPSASGPNRRKATSSTR
jgi:cell division septum initiation protein DivIVA